MPFLQTLLTQLGIAAVLAVIGFLSFFYGIRSNYPYRPWYAFLFAVVGAVFLIWAVEWNLTPGRLADAAHVYDADSWKMVAVIWPLFIWLALFVLSAIGRAPTPTSTKGHA